MRVWQFPKSAGEARRRIFEGGDLGEPVGASLPSDLADEIRAILKGDMLDSAKLKRIGELIDMQPAAVESRRPRRRGEHLMESDLRAAHGQLVAINELLGSGSTRTTVPAKQPWRFPRTRQEAVRRLTGQRVQPAEDSQYQALKRRLFSR